MEDHVYVIGPPARSVVKIGVSDNVNRRLRQIQLTSPTPLELRWFCAGSLPLEGALHDRFKHLRLHGEWFDFGDDDPVAAIQQAVFELDMAEEGSEARQKRAAAMRARHRAKYMPKGKAIFARDPSGTKVEGWPRLDDTVAYYREKEDRRPEGELRCWCGHQMGTHDSIRPHACGGSCPSEYGWSDCLCLGYEGPLPEQLADHDLPGHNWQNWRTA